MLLVIVGITAIASQGSLARAWDVSGRSYITGGTTGTDVGREIAVDPAGNIYVAGYFSATTSALPFSIADATPYTCPSNTCEANLFVTKLSPLGHVGWIRYFEGSGTLANPDGLELDDAGNLYIAGSFNNSIRFAGTLLTSAGPTTSAGYVAKLSSVDGSITWVSPISNGSYAVDVSGLDVDRAGNIAVVGNTVGPTAVTIGGLAVPGGPATTGYGYLLRLDTNGSPSWGVRFGTTSADGASGVAFSPSGDIYVSGLINDTASVSATTLANGTTIGAETPLTPEFGSGDGFVAKFSSNGVIDTNGWPIRLGGPSADVAASIDVDSTTIAVASTVYGATTVSATNYPIAGVPNKDVFITAFGTNGNHRWSDRLIGQAGANDEVRDLVIAPTGDIITSGMYGQGSRRWFVSRHEPSTGTLSWLKEFGTGPGSYDIGQAVASDCLGNVYSTGRFGGGAVDPDNPANTITARGDSDVLVVKQRPNGTLASANDPYCEVANPTGAAAPTTQLLRSSLDSNGGTCTSGNVSTNYIGYTYLPGPSDCTREGYTFGGWANRTTPTTARHFPLLTDPSDGRNRYFVAENVDLIAVWAALPQAITDLTVFANFFCGPCTNAWLLFTTPSDATDFTVAVNGTVSSCARKGTFFGLSLCELTRLLPGSTTFAVTPLKGTERGPTASTIVTMRK